MGLLIDAENMDYVSRQVRIYKCRRVSAQSSLLIQEATHLVLLVDPFEVAAKLPCGKKEPKRAAPKRCQKDSAGDRGTACKKTKS